MADLITVQDLEDRLGRPLTAAELARAPALLQDVSALIRRYTGQNFEHVIDDVITLRPVGAWLRLPQRPVIAVDQVAIIDCDGIPGDPMTGWCWDGLDKIRITGHSIKGIEDPWWPWNSAPEAFQVIYDHGYVTIPDDVVAVAAAAALRTLVTPSPVEGMVSERIGQYFYQMQQQTGTAGLTVRLTDADKDALRRYRRTAGTIALRAR